MPEREQEIETLVYYELDRNNKNLLFNILGYYAIEPALLSSEMTEEEKYLRGVLLNEKGQTNLRLRKLLIDDMLN